MGLSSKLKSAQAIPSHVQDTPADHTTAQPLINQNRQQGKRTQPHAETDHQIHQDIPREQQHVSQKRMQAATISNISAPANQRSTLQTTSSASLIEQRLTRLSTENGLSAFYDGNLIGELSGRLSMIDAVSLGRRWNLPLELVYDLYGLALYDICFFCDDSGSMIFEEDGERVDDLRLILSRVADVTSTFDEDGVVVRFMNSDVSGDFIKTAAEVQSLVASVPFGGMTPLGTNLEKKVLEPMVVRQVQGRCLTKPVLVIVITDGEPTGEPRGTILTVIRNVVRYLGNAGYGRGGLAVQVAQVGNDVRVQRFLADLDNDPEVGGNIDCTSGFELEQQEFLRKGVNLTPELWLLKMCLGAIDRSYDEQD
jgi:hypothetical protein